MASINSIAPISIEPSKELREIENDNSKNEPANLINEEKNSAELKEWNRREEFANIILNRSAADVPMKFILYPLGYIAITFVATLPLTTIPIHDIFETPESFYEYPLQVLHLPCVLAADFLLNASVWMNVSLIRTWRNVALISTVGLVADITCYSLGYAIWTLVLGFRYPIPLNAHLYWYIIITSQLIALYCIFPYYLRKNVEFGARLKNLMIAIVWHSFGFTSVHAMLGGLLLAYKNEYQWIIIIFVPWVREVCLWIMMMFTSKASCGDVTSTNLTCSFTFSVWHAVFQSYIMGSAATSESNAVLLAEESILGIYLVLKIAWIHKNNPAHIHEKARLLQKLLIKEFVGFIVPLTFISIFTAAFYGPNSDKIGNVKNSYFGYQAVEDFTEYTLRILSLFLVDFLTAVIGFILLWKYCNINCYRGLIALQKEFGGVFLVNLIRALLAVSLN